MLSTEVARGDRYSSVLVSLLDVDYVVTNRAEIGEVIDVSSKLLDDRIAQTQRQALKSAFFRTPLKIEIVLVLPILVRQIWIRAKHRQGISAQPIDPGEVITSAQKKRALARSIEILNLNTGITRIPTPRRSEVGVPPRLGESRSKQCLADRQFYFDPELVA